MSLPTAADHLPPRKPSPVWLVTAAAVILPGSGQLLNGDPIRGIVMQFFMMLLALVTYRLTGPEISFFGRFAGGLLVYVLSILDAHVIAHRRAEAFTRLTQGKAGPMPQPQFDR